MTGPGDFEFDPEDRLLELLLGDTDADEGRADGSLLFPAARGALDSEGLDSEGLDSGNLDSDGPDEGDDLDVEALQGLFRGLRSLSCEPTGRVAVTVRSAVERRARLRKPASARPPRPGLIQWPGLVQGLQVAAVAAVVAGVALLGENIYHDWQVRHGVVPGQQDASSAVAARPVRASDSNSSVMLETHSVAGGRGASGLMADLAPEPRYLAQDAQERAVFPYRLFRMKPALVERYGPTGGRLEDMAPQDVWMVATNAVDTMRLEFENRFHPALRRQAIRAAGGSRFLAARIEALADEIAVKLDRQFASGDLPVRDVALGLRALLAGGSTRRIGDHAAQVQLCTERLLKQLPDLKGGELATALSGLVEVALVSGPQVARQVGQHASRLAESVIYSKSSHRPQMLNWHAGSSELADAGMVLRLAPAFGTVNKEAVLARTYLATHLAERLAVTTEERPDLLAAQLYGYGDLIDRDEVDRRLCIWRAGDLVPEYYDALHHVAWSRFPMRLGWTDFQRQLRRVSVLDTPESVADAGSLLLSLAVSYAAPGSQELQALTMR